MIYNFRINKVWFLTGSIVFILIVLIRYMKFPLKSLDNPVEDIITKKLKGLNQWRIDPSKIKLGRESWLDPPNEPRIVEILTETFRNVDSNKDNYLDEDEITSWISRQVKDHFTLALKENVFLFTAIDLDPRNGEVSWDEYYRYMLKRRGFNETFIKNQKDSLKGMQRELKESIMRDKAAWSEAARDDPSRLTLDEFLSFRHPESSHASIASITDQLLAKLDIDDDGLLSEDEFSDPETNDVPDHLTAIQFQASRKDIFNRIVDQDNSHYAERMELLKFIDPRSAHHARQESEDLISIADSDSDSLLSLEEVLEHRNIFIVSKMVDVAKSFHDEF